MKNEIKLTGSQELQREKIELLIVEIRDVCCEAYVKNLDDSFSREDWINGYKTSTMRRDGKLQKYISYYDIRDLFNYI